MQWIAHTALLFQVPNGQTRSLCWLLATTDYTKSLDVTPESHDIVQTVFKVFYQVLFTMVASPLLIELQRDSECDFIPVHYGHLLYGIYTSFATEAFKVGKPESVKSVFLR